MSYLQKVEKTMSIGNSGRIVIEIDAEFKKTLYSVLEKNKLTLKDWFLHNAESYVSETVQPSLFRAGYFEESEHQ